MDNLIDLHYDYQSTGHRQVHELGATRKHKTNKMYTTCSNYSYISAIPKRMKSIHLPGNFDSLMDNMNRFALCPTVPNRSELFFFINTCFYNRNLIYSFEI